MRRSLVSKLYNKNEQRIHFLIANGMKASANDGCDFSSCLHRQMTRRLKSRRNVHQGIKWLKARDVCEVARQRIAAYLLLHGVVLQLVDLLLHQHLVIHRLGEDLAVDNLPYIPNFLYVSHTAFGNRTAT